MHAMRIAEKGSDAFYDHRFVRPLGPLVPLRPLGRGGLGVQV